MKTVLSSLGALIFIGVVFAAPLGTLAAINPGPSCTALSSNLFRGSSGSEVTLLQRFLVAQNYPGGGSWMVTGYYGSATQVAVQNFQISAGLPQTGSVDSATRTAIQSYSCGTAYNNYNQYTYTPYTYTNTYYDPYAYTNNYQYGQGIVLGASTGPYYYGNSYTNCSYYNCAPQSITISYVNPMSGASGANISIYGAGFSEDNNTVHLGNGIVPFLRSSNNGTALSFTVPTSLSGYGSQSIYNQTYDLYVTNSYGQNSNRVSFSVTSGGNTNGNYSLYGVSGPNTLAQNTSGTWSMSVYGPANATVTVDAIWGDEYQQNSNSTSHQSIFLGNNGMGTLSFTHAYTVSGVYTPTFIVSNSYGSNASASAQTVTVGNGYNNSGSVSLSSLSPASGQAGTQVILFGSGFTAYDNTIHFGIGGQRTVASVSNGSALYFTIPHYVSPCDTVVGSCNASPTIVTPGSYPVYVTNGNGTTQTLNFTVTN